jgi:RND family efflux transporter MFP subunit
VFYIGLLYTKPLVAIGNQTRLTKRSFNKGSSMKSTLFSGRNIAIILLIVIIGIFAYLKFDKNAAKPEEPTLTRKPALTVETVQAKTVNWPMMLDVSGTVFPWQEAVVSSEISGLRIQSLLVDVGSAVTKGQLLAQLSDETVLADLHKQQAVVERDRASLAQAKSNADRARDIQQSGALSAQKINEYLIAEQTAEANLSLSLAELDNQQIRLRQTKVLAADNGIISSRTATLGNVVSAGAELFRFIRQGRIEWRAELNATLLSRIKTGQVVKVNKDGQSIINGTVRMIGPTIDTNSRNGLIYIDLPKNSVKPGDYLSGAIDMGEESADVLPQSSVILRDGIAYVFEVVNSDRMHKVIQRKVETGRTQGEMIELLSGLDKEANYILTGGAFLNDGDVVSVVNNVATYQEANQ